MDFFRTATALALLAVLAGAPSREGRAQVPDEDAELLGLIATHLRAHPAARGPIVLTRHERIHDRTTREEGTLAVDPSGARVTLGASAELAVRPDLIEAFDGSSTPPLLLVLRGETPLARYAAIAAGEELTVTFVPRVLRRDGERASLELLPRAPWPGLERVVVTVRLDGAERGRLERVLWLDDAGNWQRVELERLSYPARLDPSALAPAAHPGARRVEL